LSECILRRISPLVEEIHGERRGRKESPHLSRAPSHVYQFGTITVAKLALCLRVESLQEEVVGERRYVARAAKGPAGAPSPS
jgi:hypothetical protein